ncbi:MAG: DNRLRE domain-containing protein, partial [Nocardioides sp.]|nr:DNRLRE domain-containing protein [Nocardioides sp.]
MPARAKRLGTDRLLARRLLLGSLAALLLGTGLSPVVPNASAADLLDQGPQEQVPTLPENAFTTSMESSSGQILSTVQAYPVNESVNDNWEPATTGLVPLRSENFLAKMDGPDLDIKIPSNLGAQPFRLEADGEWITVQPRHFDSEGDLQESAVTFEAPAVALGVTETVVEATADGLKEFHTIDAEPASPLVLRYQVRASRGVGASYDQRTGDVVFQSSGDVLAVLPQGVMWDANPLGDPSNIPLRLDAVEGGWEVSMAPDFAWMTDPARQYPVTVDPAINASPTETRDCWINSARPDASACQTDYLRVGRKNASTKYRSLLRFDLSAIPSSAVVRDARVNLYLESSRTLDSTKSAGFRVHAVGKPFGVHPSWNSPDPGTWSAGDPVGAGSSAVTMSGGTSGFKEFSGLATAAQDAIAQGRTKLEFVVKMDVESTNNVLQFYSSLAGSTYDGKRPYLSLSYDTAPEISNVQATPGGSGFVTSGTPTFSATIADPDGDTSTAKFSVYDGDTPIWSGTSAAVTGARTVSVTPEEPILDFGGNYRLEVVGTDDALVGVKKTVNLRADIAAPTVPAPQCQADCTVLPTPITVYDGNLGASGASTIGLMTAIPDFATVVAVQLSVNVRSASGQGSLTVFNPDFPQPIAPSRSWLNSAAAVGTSSLELPISPNGLVRLANGDAATSLSLAVTGVIRSPASPEEAELAGYEDGSRDIAGTFPEEVGTGPSQFDSGATFTALELSLMGLSAQPSMRLSADATQNESCTSDGTLCTERMGRSAWNSEVAQESVEHPSSMNTANRDAPSVDCKDEGWDLNGRSYACHTEYWKLKNWIIVNGTRSLRGKAYVFLHSTINANPRDDRYTWNYQLMMKLGRGSLAEVTLQPKFKCANCADKIKTPRLLSVNVFSGTDGVQVDFESTVQTGATQMLGSIVDATFYNAEGRPFTNDARTYSAAIRCDALTYLKYFSYSHGCVMVNYRPVWTIAVDGLWPPAAKHIRRAQNAGLAGKPGKSPLTRASKTAQTQNRALKRPRFDAA